MMLTPEAIEAYKIILENPKDNGFDFPPLSKVFEKTEKATAKHVLFLQYLKLVKVPVPKLIFYIIMDDLYTQSMSDSGNLGYCARMVAKEVLVK